MDVKELRIGNYVNVYCKVEENGWINTKVVGIKENEIIFKLPSQGSFNIYNLTSLIDEKDTFTKPIPLTEEILLKCGFFCCDDEYYIGEFKLLYFHRSKEFEFLNHDFPIRIEYLHQLQNLYYALTVTELQINL